jgi:hypothetical protein
MECIVVFWMELWLEVPDNKVMKKAKAAARGPTKKDYNKELTTLRTLILLVDAGYRFDDWLLKRSAFSILRTRLHNHKFTVDEFTGAAHEEFSRRNETEGNRKLCKAFLSAAILHYIRLRTNSEFRELQCLSPDLTTAFNEGVLWYIRVFLPGQSNMDAPRQFDIVIR